jgi:enoyl-[acyl-carrier protein] reductase I
VLTLSYYGAEKAIPHYNVMGVAKAALEASVRYLAADLGPAGIRVNAISAGPHRPWRLQGSAASEDPVQCRGGRTPLHRNVTQAEVASAALYLCSDLASSVTGEVMHVDAGYNVVGCSVSPCCRRVPRPH